MSSNGDMASAILALQGMVIEIGQNEFDKITC